MSTQFPIKEKESSKSEVLPLIQHLSSLSFSGPLTGSQHIIARLQQPREVEGPSTQTVRVNSRSSSSSSARSITTLCTILRCFSSRVCNNARTELNHRTSRKKNYDPLTIPVASAGLGRRGLRAGGRHVERRLLPGPVPPILLVAGTLF
jgi:hypothetical protein